MKKFQFSLENVLKYKNQTLDSLKIEHGRILADLRREEAVLADLRRQYGQKNAELNEKNAKGSTPLEISSYKYYMQSLQGRIKAQEAAVAKVRIQEEAKKAEVVEMKKETATFDMLKEKRMEEYRKAEQKEEENRIDELVANKMYSEKVGY